MPFHTTPIDGLIVFEPQIWKDDRGYFFESYNQKTFETGGIEAVFVQDNQAFSTYGVLRGLHYQVDAAAQAKLVRVIEGEVLDVAVDLRPHSKTYGEWYSIRLSAANAKQLFVPRGFAHGYLVLSETAIFCYKCDNLYNKQAEGGLNYNDKYLNINWEIPIEDILLSPKDKDYPHFGHHKN